MAEFESVRDALHQEPFRPFELRLVDGRSFVVRHPDFVALPPSPRKRDVVFYDEAGLHILDLGLILEITLAVGAAPGR
jgi:hypothetical protein